MRGLRIALAQINTTVGDITGNVKKVNEYISMAKDLRVDLIAFPELCITGYPPEDLLLNSSFIEDNLRALDEVAKSSKDITIIIGFVDKDDDIFNAAAIISDGEVIAKYHKMYLPNYGVFDEFRYFQSGRDIMLFSLHDVTIGVSICEDIWYPGDPTRAQALLGNAELIVNISSSPFYSGKSKFREMMLCTRASDNKVKIAYVNLVGGQDELVFDGCSFIINEKGHTVAIGKQFEEDLIVADINADDVFRERLHDPRRRAEKISLTPSEEDFYHKRIKRIMIQSSKKREPKPPLPKRDVKRLEGVEEIYSALKLGIRDYVRKNSFEKVLIGISGGIDSALTAAIAVDALGRDSVV
ncbi:MAG: nitrilase-related carbon-nitrogen hydrolase, partial [Candidatus Aenigmatarchaeota archaeon]